MNDVNEKINNLYDALKKSNPEHLITNSESDIVIEGYPRSSNTFLVDYIRYLYDREGLEQLKIGHHTHNYKNVELGFAYKIPVIILIRAPENAILSSYIYTGVESPLDNRFQHYISFYTDVKRDIDRVLVIRFEEVVNCIDMVISKIRDRFGLPIPTPALSNDELAEVTDMERKRGMKLHGDKYNTRNALPNKERNILKKKYSSLISEHSRMSEASELYLSLLSYLNETN